MSGQAALPSGYRFPLERTSTRDLGDYEGPVDVWDIDKTYLITDFERLRDLLWRALESAPQKSTRPGAAALLRGLRRGAGEGLPPRPLFFVSASPPQMRAVIEEKMHLDGVAFDGIAFKDWWRVMRRGRLRDLKRHTAYKLTALLEYRCEWPVGAREWLYGDDAESDARIYSIYAAIRAGELAGAALDDELARAHVDEADRQAIAALAARAQELAPPPPGGSVAGIFILRARPAPRDDLAGLARVEVVEDALDLAARLRARGRVDDAVVAEVAAAMRGPGAPATPPPPPAPPPSEPQPQPAPPLPVTALAAGLTPAPDPPDPTLAPGLDPRGP